MALSNALHAFSKSSSRLSVMAKYMYELGKSGLRLIAALKKWKADAYWPVLRCTSPKLYDVIHSNGSRYSARLRQATDAT